MELNNITGRRVNNTRIWPNNDYDYAIPGAITMKNNYENISTITATEKFPHAPRDITVPNFVADTVALRKVYIFCGMLLTLLVISSVTIGILTHSLMMRADATETKTDELQTDVNNLQDDIRCDPTGLKELQTKLMEVESRLEAYKAITDAEFRKHLSKLTQLETRINDIESGSGVAPGQQSAFAIAGAPTYNNSTNVAIFPSGDVTTNIGSQYSTTTGQFICQRAGLYVFILSLYRNIIDVTLWLNGSVRCAIRKNGQSVVIADCYRHHLPCSGSTVLHLEPGDSVDVGDCTMVYASIHNSTSFVGFLLHAD